MEVWAPPREPGLPPLRWLEVRSQGWVLVSLEAVATAQWGCSRFMNQCEVAAA
jgi:hypothetical protein